MTQPDVDAQSAAEAIRAIVRDEIDDARRRDREQVARAARGLAALAGAFFLLYLATVFLTLMFVYILGVLIEPWIGAAIVGSTLLVVAAFVSRGAWRYFRRMVSGAR
jgi:fatty acid desaturase